MWTLTTCDPILASRPFSSPAHIPLLGLLCPSCHHASLSSPRRMFSSDPGQPRSVWGKHTRGSGADRKHSSQGSWTLSKIASRQGHLFGSIIKTETRDCCSKTWPQVSLFKGLPGCLLKADLCPRLGYSLSAAAWPRPLAPSLRWRRMWNSTPTK